MFRISISTLFKKEKGFTLIELMVVTVIITIMTTIVLINYRAGGRQLALERSANKLAQDIRRIQEMAMSSKEEKVCPLGFEGGYGIRFSRGNDPPHYPGKEQYTLFADCNNDGRYNDEILDNVIEKVEYEPGIIFCRVQYRYPPLGWNPGGLGCIGEPTVDIIFSPPDPERYIVTANPVYNEAPEQKFMLKVEEGGRIKCIYVNKAGLIYVIDC